MLNFRRYLLVIILLINTILLGACADDGGVIESPIDLETTQETPPLEDETNQTATNTDIAPSIVDGSTTAVETKTPINATVAPQPDIPSIAKTLNFGLSTGNAPYPYVSAIDAKQQRLYSLHNLDFSLSQDKTAPLISVFDLKSKQFVSVIEVENTMLDSLLYADAIALQLDPTHSRLYALWGNRYGNSDQRILSIIDTDTLTIIDHIPDVGAMVTAFEKLYLINSQQLWSIDPLSLSPLVTANFSPSEKEKHLWVNENTKQLYLATDKSSELNIFNADNLTLLESQPLNGEISKLFVDLNQDRLVSIEKEEDTFMMRFLAFNGEPLFDFEPLPLPIESYNTPVIANTTETLFLAAGTHPDTWLYAIQKNAPTIHKLFALPCQPKSLVANTPPNKNEQLLYGPCNTPESILLLINPTTGLIETHYTNPSIISAVADPNNNHLYLLDNQGILKQLTLTDHTELNRLQTQFNTLTNLTQGGGQLSLDSGHKRLYISGNIVQIVNIETLSIITQLDLPGQITADPSSNRLYLTPPCKCKAEQCNTLIYNAETLMSTQTVFPVEDPFTAPCVTNTVLDTKQQLLYARINNGTPGSNSGFFYKIFDVRQTPIELYGTGNISYGKVVIDPNTPGAFIPRYRMDSGFIERFEIIRESAEPPIIEKILEVANIYGQLAYDPTYNRLYAIFQNTIQVFDDNLALQTETSLASDFNLLTFDSKNQRLYLTNNTGTVIVMATSGGQPSRPTEPTIADDTPQIQYLYPTASNTQFRLFNGRVYRAEDDSTRSELLGLGLPDRHITALAVSPNYKNDTTLFVAVAHIDGGVGNSLYVSKDEGNTWTPTTLGLTGLDIRQIKISPTFAEDKTIFLHTPRQGLFKSIDGGNSWDSLAHTYSPNLSNLSLDDLAISPTFSQDGLIFISKRTLLRSNDGGQSWVDTGIDGGTVAFSPDFANDGLILNDGRWRSTDSGETWEPAAAGRQNSILAAEKIMFSPTFSVDQTIYLALKTDYYGPLTLHRSTNAGRSWQILKRGLPLYFNLQAISLFPNGLLAISDSKGNVQQITPTMLEWDKTQADIRTLELQAFVIAPDGSFFVANGGAGVFKSTDKGQTWTETDFPARSNTAYTAHLAIGQDGTLFAAVGSALEYSTDGGTNWNHINTLPQGFEITSLAVSPNVGNDGVVLVGGNYNDNRLLRSEDGGQSWTAVFAGNEIVGSTEISALALSTTFNTDSIAYAWLQYGGLLRSIDGGRTWGLALADSDRFAQSMLAKTGEDGILLGALGGQVFSWQANATDWQDLSPTLATQPAWLTALAVSSNNTLFVGTDIGVYRSTNNGESWQAANAGLPQREGDNMPYAIKELQIIENELYAALADGGVFVSTDNGQSWYSTITGEPASPLETQTRAIPTEETQLTSPPPTPAVICTTPPTFFAELWLNRQAQLGCPLANGSQEGILLVKQQFDGGLMVWRSDTSEIYVLPTNQPYSIFPDMWEESLGSYTCPDIAPPQTPPTPQRGFGKVWCDNETIRQQLGNATSTEQAFNSTLQPFTQGLIFVSDNGVYYILSELANTWEEID